MVGTNECANGSIGSFDEYRRFAYSFEDLTLKEEEALWRLLLTSDWEAALNTLVNHHLKLAVGIAWKLTPYPRTEDKLMDAVAAANEGLSKAARKFDPERGVRFSTYAIWWIKQCVKEEMMKTYSLVQSQTKTSEAKRVFFKLPRELSKRGINSATIPDEILVEIAEVLNTTPEMVKRIHAYRAGELSLNAPLLQSEDGGIETWFDRLESENAESTEDAAAHNVDFERLVEDLPAIFKRVLKPRERFVIRARRYTDEPMTLELVGKILSISKERVRQIEKRALEKLEKAKELQPYRAYVSA